MALYEAELRLPRAGVRQSSDLSTKSGYVQAQRVGVREQTPHKRLACRRITEAIAGSTGAAVADGTRPIQWSSSLL